MVVTRKSRRKEAASKLEYKSQKGNSNLEGKLKDFVESLGDILVDITALEVNTMIVERITGDKFIAWEVYRELYPISKQYLEQQGIHKSLRDRYIDLRRKLELEYALLLTDTDSEFYDPAIMSMIVEDVPILTDPKIDLDQIQTKLPPPIHPFDAQENAKTKKLLSNSRFLRSLRKIGELKIALDNRNSILHRKEEEQPHQMSSQAIAKIVNTDMIYAQTIIQLDGNIINRYSQEILDHPHKNLLLQIHRDGVMAGEIQWRGLLSFVVDMAQKTLKKGGWFLPKNDKSNSSN